MLAYEIYSYGNADALSGLFNMIAAVMNGNVFVSALALVFVVGFFGALFGTVFSSNRMVGPRWLMSVVLMYAILYLPKGTIQVVDKVGSATPQVIANVPLGLAVQASLVSSVGNTLTDLFETAAETLPDGSGGLDANLSYQGHGLMFGSKLIRHSLLASLGDADPVLHGDVVNFLQNCTIYDVSQGLIDPQAFATSTNVWPLLGNTNRARFTPITSGTGAATTVTSMTCPDAYTNLGERLQPAIDGITQKLGLSLNPYLQQMLAQGSPLPGAEAATLLGQQMPAAYAFAGIARAGTAAATLIQQNALMNAFQEASAMGAQAANDPTAAILGLGMAQSRAQANGSFLLSGKLAEEALPLVRNVLEAVLYGLFPFVLLLAIVMGGMAAFQLLKGYAMGLIWLSLWPPIYAIINYFGSLYAAKHAAANAFMNAATSGVSMMTGSVIYGDTISDMAVIGYMVTAVPVIAGAVVFGLNQIAGVATGFLGGVTNPTGHNAREMATGDISMGHVDVNNGVAKFADRSGAYQLESIGSLVSYDPNIGSSLVHFGTTSEISNRYSAAAARSASLASDESKQADRITEATYQQARSLVDSHSVGVRDNQAETASHGNANDKTVTDSNGQSAQNRNTSTYTSQTNANVAAFAEASAGASLGVFGAKAGVKGEVGHGWIWGQSEDRSNSASASHDESKRQSELESFINSKEFAEYKTQHHDEALRIEHGVRQAHDYRVSSSKHMHESEEYRQNSEMLRSAAVRGDVNWDKQFNAYLYQHGAIGPGQAPLTMEQTLEWGSRFFRESGLAQAINGEAKLAILPFDGHGPHNVNWHPQAPPTLRKQFDDSAIQLNGTIVTPHTVASRKSHALPAPELHPHHTPMNSAKKSEAAAPPSFNEARIADEKRVVEAEQQLLKDGDANKFNRTMNAIWKERDKH